MCVLLHQAFEEQERKLLFKNIHAKSIKVKLRNAILLDSQYTMDLFYNIKLFGKIYKAKKKMRLRSNGGKILISHKAQVAVYKPHVWFDQKAITKLIDLKNPIRQYSVTYDSLDDIFIVHQKEHRKHNMHFRMH